ncbi:MAG: hypothetical protein M1834_004552 [Cirrosporium novae-zelandiae]|nr:MAG: hypothetical protein M1834_004552 [Cirrosporium novae-zelandiae]
MRVLGSSALFAQPTGWTCRQCRFQQLVKTASRRLTHTGPGYRTSRTTRQSRQIALAASTGTLGLGAGVLAFGDDIKSGYEGAERTGRVLAALAMCINDYRVTLNKKEKEDEKNGKELLKACHKRCAERTLRVLETNGSMFIKFGQHLSSMNYLLPPEWTNTFIPLQDKCPVSSYESIEEMFVTDMGKPIEEYFDDFGKVPIGAASLAQVHIATLKESGEKVAVKIQHPALDKWVPLDLALTTFTFSTLKRFFPDYDLEWLADELETSLPQELDFAREGQNALRAKKYFKDHPNLPLVIPDVKWAQRRILVMEYVSGNRLDDLEYLDSHGIDRDEVSASLARIFNEMIFGDGAPLHCDPHAGNIAVRKNDSRRSHNFDIILYDHGLYRDIPKQLRRDYAKLWLAVLDSDEKKMRESARNVAGITDEQFPLFASAITGRDYLALKRSPLSPRNEQEKEHISDALIEGLLQQLVQLLGNVPRVVLLILKTNDLTRSLDENLHTRQGPLRTFLILARYCSRTVFGEQMEYIHEHGGIIYPRLFFSFVGAWASFMRVELKLSLYEYFLWGKRLLGFQ